MSGAASGACAARPGPRRRPQHRALVERDAARGLRSGHSRQADLRRSAHWREGKTMAPPIVTPNLFHLTGSHIHITYSTSSSQGTPTMTYQDAHRAMSFQGDEIRAVECDLGTLVSVTLRMTIDTGSTSLSVFIPRVRLEQGTIVAIHTDCVTTIHRFSVIPSFNLGQLDTYSVAPLHGTAQFVVF
jgi:hypothetical protein